MIAIKQTATAVSRTIFALVRIAATGIICCHGNNLASWELLPWWKLFVMVTVTDKWDARLWSHCHVSVKTVVMVLQFGAIKIRNIPLNSHIWGRGDTIKQVWNFSSIVNTTNTAWPKLLNKDIKSWWVTKRKRGQSKGHRVTVDPFCVAMPKQEKRWRVWNPS